MLDKSLPYYNVIMKRSANIPVMEPALPEGFSFVYYSDGLELKWADIECSVGEFDTIEAATDYFVSKYLPYVDELYKRLIFVRDKNDDEIATVTGWWDDSVKGRDASLHWLAVKPGYQGLGIGKALVHKCLQVLGETERNKDVYLHTQTWSYKAIGIYLKMGFEIVETETFGHYKNDYWQAKPFLMEKLKGFL
jgi:ribosomal protein S18 acetylase RimI-like enzyme